MFFSAAVEGPSDEAALRKVLSISGDDLGPVYGRNGKGSILRGLAGYNNAARFEAWIVLLDLDNEDCAVTSKEMWLPTASPYMCLRIVVRELESWLLADKARFAAYFSVSRDLIPDNPDRIDDPKLTLLNIIRKSKRNAIKDDMLPDQNLGQSIGPAYTSRIIEYIQSDQGWRADVAAQNSPSLSRAISAIRRLKQAFASA